jgi:SAM-dependent methyltransferase
VELRRYVEAGEFATDAGVRPRAIELGCGTGTNAVYLAQQGFEVTAVDFATDAIARAERRAAETQFAAGTEPPRFVLGDVTKLDAVVGPFDLLFDRACYHCVRRAGLLSGYLATVRRLTAPGARLLVIAGNPDAGEVGGPPKVSAAELTGDFEKLCRIERLIATRFEEADGSAGPLGWSLLMTRR